MSELIPSGYLSVQEALNRVGRNLFALNWTGDEHKARPGLISETEWVRTKDMPPARGCDASGSPVLQRPAAPASSPPPHLRDPGHPLYQEEYRARERHEAALLQLREWLEANRLQSEVLDPWKGTLHPLPTSVWRRHRADRLLEKAQAPIPHSPNTGTLLIKVFAEASAQKTAMPRAKVRDAIEALKEAIATKSLTRPQQAEFLRKSFPNHHITERQLNDIYQAIPARIGRPKKSGK